MDWGTKQQIVYELWWDYLNTNADYLDVSNKFSGKNYVKDFIIIVLQCLSKDTKIHTKADGDIKSMLDDMLSLCDGKPLEIVKRSIQCYLVLGARPLLKDYALNHGWVHFLLIDLAVSQNLGISRLEIGPGRLREKELKKYFAVYKLKKKEKKQWKEIIQTIDGGLYKRIVSGNVMLESARRDYQNYLSKAKTIGDNALNGAFPGKY